MKTKNIIITIIALSAIGIIGYNYHKKNKKDPRALFVGQKVWYYGDLMTIEDINYADNSYLLKSISGTKSGRVPYSSEIIPA